MRITVNPVLDMETLTWVAHDGVYEHTGPVVQLKKSKEAKANEAAQAAFYKQTTEQQNIMFKAQVELLDRIKAVTEPILARGPQQYGFTPEEDALLRSEIIDRSAEATGHAVSATQLREQQRTGGTKVLPAGADAQLEETARVLGVQSTARSLAAERLEGYRTGNALYAQALGALSGVGGLQDPVRYTGAATGAGQAATSAIQLADSQRSNLLNKLLGGAISGGLALATGGASKALGITPVPGLG